MAKTFDFSIASLEKVIYEGKVISINVLCEGGYVGVLAGHAPFIGKVLPAEIVIRDKDNKKISIPNNHKGILEISANTASIIL